MYTVLAGMTNSRYFRVRFQSIQDLEISMFKGSITALITPFDRDGAIDEKAFQDFVDWQLKQGTPRCMRGEIFRIAKRLS